ncbi:MAG: tandem-95 repeat protein [Actinomycetota bacterium]
MSLEREDMPTSTEQAETKASARQDLDDLTVLNNVANQDLGAPVLNQNRAVDTDDAKFGTLAMVHQGSRSAPEVLDVTHAFTGQAPVSIVSVETDTHGPAIAGIDNVTLAATEGGMTAEAVTAQPVAQTLSDAPPIDLSGGAHAEILAATVTAPDAPTPTVVTAPEMPAPTGGVAEAAPAPAPVPPPEEPVPVNHAPTAENVAATGAEDTPIRFGLVYGDMDGDALSVSLGQPAHGVVRFDAESGQYEYIPDENWSGADSITYTVTDPGGASVTRTIAITVDSVNDAPVIVSAADGVGTEDHAVTGHIIATDVEGDTLAYTLADGGAPAHGSVTFAEDGSYTYVPAENWNGTDAFTVTVSDGHGGSATRTVNLEVTSVNDAPVVTELTGGSGNEDQPVTGRIVATDVEGDTLAYTLADGGAPAHGSVSFADDGSYTYVPAADWNGTDTFTVTVSDGQGGSETRTVTVEVASVDDAPVVTEVTGDGGTGGGGTGGGDIALAGTEDHAITGHIVATDVDGDQLSFGLADGGAPGHGSVAFGPDGSYTYTPATDWNGTDSFTVAVSDGHGGSVTRTVTVEVAGVNDAPVVTEVTGGHGTEDHAVTGRIAATDVDGDQIAYTLADGGAPAHGTVSFAADGSYTYVPADNWSGTDAFTVTVSDGHGGSVARTVAVEVAPEADTPTLTVGATVVPTTDQGIDVETTAGTATVTHSGGGDTDYGNESGTIVIHAAGNAGNGHEANSFDIYLNGAKIGSGGPGTTTISGHDVHDGDVLNFVGNRGTNVEVDAITVDGETVDVGTGIKHGGAQVDATHDTFDLHNGSVSYTLNDGGAGSTAYTQPLHLELTGNEAEAGGLVLGGFSAGDVVSDQGHTWIADANGAITITEAQLDGMVSGIAIDHDFTVTSLTAPVTEVTSTVLTHAEGGTFIGGGGNDVVLGQGGNDVIWGDQGVGSVTALLDISATDADPSETLSYAIGGLPAGCSLANDHGLLAAGSDGVYSLSAADLAGLKVTMPEGTAAFDLSVTAIAHDGASVAEAEAALHLDPAMVGGADTLTGGAGADLLEGGAGNDVLNYSTDGTWTSGWYAYDAGSPGTAGTAEMIPIAGDNRSTDVFHGGAGTDTIVMGDGNDALFLDDQYSPINAATGGMGPRFDGVEVIEAGAGNDVVDLTSDKYAYGNVTIDGGSGNDLLWGSKGNDLIVGGTGDDHLHGGAGADTLIGGAGNDTLQGQDGSDTMLFDFQGHDVADGGHGSGWSDTIDLTEAGAGVTFTVELDDGRSWTVTTDGKGEHRIDLGQDAAGHVTVAGEDKVDFTNVEEVRW